MEEAEEDPPLTNSGVVSEDAALILEEMAGVDMDELMAGFEDDELDLMMEISQTQTTN